MPFTIEHEGKQVEVWTKDEVEAEVAGLKVTNKALKTEKQEALDAAKVEKERATEMELAKAKAEGDKETLERLAKEKEDETKNQLNRLLDDIASEKTSGALNDVVTRLGAGGEHNEDLRDLLKARYSFDYDHETKAVKVSGAGINSLEELESQIKDGERYARYLAGSKATGAGAAGSAGAGASNKKLSEMNDAERIEFKNRDPEGFKRALNA